MSDSRILELKNLNVAYGQVPVIRGVSLHVDKGETVALIGANGAGKTTILRTISGLLRPSSGQVLWQGNDIGRERVHKIVRLGISHVPERRGIFANLTVYENLLMGGYTQKLKPADFDEVYSLFPRLKERVKQVAGTLSGGEQQMLAISRALLSRPKMILLDEPSLGLAPLVTKSIFEIIQKINAGGTTVLLVEQNAHAALRVSHRGYVLEVGEVTHTDRSEALLQNDAVRRAYLGDH